MTSNDPTSSNSLGLSGLPPFDPPRISADEDAPEDEQVNQHGRQRREMEDHGLSTPRRPTLMSRASASDPDLTDLDRLSALPNRFTFPRRSTSNSPKRSTAQPISEQEGRRSVESEPTPPRSSHGSPRLRSAVDALKAGLTRAAASDPLVPLTRAASPPRPSFSPRWPFMPLHPTRSRQDPFRPEDPYKSHTRSIMSRKSKTNRWLNHLIRQLIRNFLLRLPSTYFSRVRRVFEIAQVSKGEVQRMIAAPLPEECNQHTISPSVARFTKAWEEFIDSVIKEWKTLNIVSALLTTGILTLFQIDEASNQPLTRVASLLSMVCALMSLIFGCTFILRFGTMRGLRKAVRWAEEMERTTTFVFWNVWILLATPAIWAAWSMIFFCIGILSFVWTTGTTVIPQPLTPKEALAPRILISAVFCLGVIVFIAVIHTFKSWGEIPQPRHGHGNYVPETLATLAEEEFKRPGEPDGSGDLV